MMYFIIFYLHDPKILHFGYLDDFPPSFFNCLHHGPSLVKFSDLYTKISFLNFLLSISLNIYISDIWAFCLQMLFNCSPHWPTWVKISDLYQKITHFIIFTPYKPKFLHSGYLDGLLSFVF